MAALIGLAVTPSKSQRQRVSTLCAGPVCAYVGKVLDQVPLLTRYCKLEPAGQGVPLGAAIVPPLTVQVLSQLLFVILTLSGAVVRVGQLGQRLGAVFAEAVVLTQFVVVFLQRANTVIAEVV
jgi:hypothetical protein